MSDPGDPRLNLCRKLGLTSRIQAHNLIAEGARKGPDTLLHHGLNADRLRKLGYTIEGMRRLGYTAEALARLGYKEATPESPAAAVRPSSERPAGDQLTEVKKPELRGLIEAGRRAPQLKERGWTVQHCKRAGCPISELIRLGFQLPELRQVCSAAELRREGFGPRELNRYYNGDELKSAGFSAGDMRLAGYTIRDLVRLGYNENHIRTAGFSNLELMREGLSRTTRDQF